MVMYPAGCYSSAPAQVQKAWDRLVLVTGRQRIAERFTLLVHAPKHIVPGFWHSGQWVQPQMIPDEWYIGSNVEDGRNTLVYCAIQNRWRLRNSRTGEDTAICEKRVEDEIDFWGVF